MFGFEECWLCWYLLLLRYLGGEVACALYALCCYRAAALLLIQCSYSYMSILLIYAYMSIYMHICKYTAQPMFHFIVQYQFYILNVGPNLKLKIHIIVLFNLFVTFFSFNPEWVTFEWHLFRHKINNQKVEQKHKILNYHFSSNCIETANLNFSLLSEGGVHALVKFLVVMINPPSTFSSSSM